MIDYEFIALVGPIWSKSKHAKLQKAYQNSHDNLGRGGEGGGEACAENCVWGNEYRYV